ncbi:hypothetical protein PHMEG_00031424 [Phytophthora megakarya]|uniref:Uncharacterized protein n=1 Tax=Phytophthora megakarya TaxID=4795 RepID=A0A225V0H5_9STRA|nr:hypothetical protein PHMEG_00031424 [Phytophthora megakarya]
MGKPTKKTRTGSCFQTSVSSRRVITASPKLSPTIKFPKKVLKWASGFISPSFTLRGSDKCWMRILNARVRTPIPAKLQIQCLASEIARFADYMNPQHSWQKSRRKFPPQAYLFDTTEFDQESSLSQRAPPGLRYRGYLRNFRGAGHKKDPEFGFSQWKRDHWIPPRAVELFITMAFTTLRLNTSNFDRLEILEIKAMLGAVDDAWRDYNIDRVKRNDRLRTKYPYICWKWSLESPPPVDGMILKFLFEPTMPLYGMEYLTWIPKTPMWLKEVAELDAREPWHNDWLDCPEKHPYNTTFYPCNPDRPLFVPVGHSLGSICPLIVRDPALTNAEIVGGWEQTFQGSPPVVESLIAYDPTPEELAEPAEIVGGWEQTFQGSPPVVESLIAYDPTPEELAEPADPPELLLLDRLMALAKDTDFTQDNENPASTSRENDDEVVEEEESEQEEIEEPPPIIEDEDVDSSTQII